MSVKIIITALFLAISISVGHGKPPNKIVGGTQAVKSEFPHQASIRTRNQHMCGGTIIDNIHILTAAHCFVDASQKAPVPSDYDVLVGINDRTDTKSGQKCEILKIQAHKDYNSKDSDKNDIAVVTLKTPIVFSSSVKAINLPTKDTPAQTKVTASGWGALDFNRGKISLPQHLQKVDLTAISTDSCASTLKMKLYPEQICAFRAKGQGTCVGDSGGPLIANNEIVGIVSFGRPCGIGMPDVFTRVHKYLSWIKNAIASATTKELKSSIPDSSELNITNEEKASTPDSSELNVPTEKKERCLYFQC